MPTEYELFFWTVVFALFAGGGTVVVEWSIWLDARQRRR